jgi:hypothetical protein
MAKTVSLNPLGSFLTRRTSRLGDFNDRYSAFALDPVASAAAPSEARATTLCANAASSRDPHAIQYQRAGNEGNNRQSVHTAPQQQPAQQRKPQSSINFYCIRSSALSDAMQSLLFCLFLGYMRIICTRAAIWHPSPFFDQ